MLIWNNKSSKVDAWKVNSTTKDWEDYGRSTASLRSLATIMNWAITESVVLPPELHGKRTTKDRLQAANLIGYNLFIGWIEQAGRPKN